jgi:hypothetical protein
VGAEALYLHLLAKNAPREQYAREALRGSYRLWQVRNAMVAGGATVLAGCLIYAGLNAWRMYSLQEDIRADRSQAAMAGAQYDGIRAKFPAMPTTTDNLRTAMQQYGTVVKQTRMPTTLLADLSRAMSASPKIEIEQLQWENAPALKKFKSAAQPPAAVPGLAPAADTRYEIVEVNARVLAARANDYRATMQIVNAFLDEVRKQPGIEVVATELPFDIGSQKTLTGDVGIEQRSEEPRFKVVVARRIAP